MSSSSSSHDSSSSDDEMLFDEEDQEVAMFSNVLLMLSTTILFIFKAYRLAINFETQNKAYKKPFGNMDRMPKVDPNIGGSWQYPQFNVCY
jgi:hypothetical protein